MECKGLGRKKVLGPAAVSNRSRHLRHLDSHTRIRARANFMRTNDNNSISMAVDQERIKSELAAAGISIQDIYDLVNTDRPYPAAVPILLRLLNEDTEPDVVTEGVIRALAVKEAIGKAGPVLISAYNKTQKDKSSLRWAIGNTMYMVITKDDVNDILAIGLDKGNGTSRQMFVAALGKVKSEEAEDVLLCLLDDEEVATHALEALGRMKSKMAVDKIAVLLNHPRSLIRKEARSALKKIER